MNLTARLAGLAAAVVTTGVLAAIPASADQTPAPQCYDLRECSFLIKRITIEADNLRSDVARLQYGVDGANNALAVARDNAAGQRRDIERLTTERDSWRDRADALAADDAADDAELARLTALVARLRDRLALPDTRCRFEDSLDCVWHSPSSGNGRGSSFYTTFRDERRTISHARAARMIGYAD